MAAPFMDEDFTQSGNLRRRKMQAPRKKQSQETNPVQAFPTLSRTNLDQEL